MTDLRQAAQQALEALREFGYHGSSPRWERTANALKAALAQPEQEPVAWNVIDPTGNILATEKNAIRGWARVNGYKPTVEGLLGLHELGWRVLPTSPPAAQPEQEPTPWRDMIVATLVREGINKHRARELADHFAAQPEQEPVAYYHPRNGFYWAKPTSIFAPTAVDVPPMPLYAAPPAAQPPPEWVELTIEEVQFYIKKHSKLVNAGYDKATDTNLVTETFDSAGFYKEVSAALKERNT